MPWSKWKALDQVTDHDGAAVYEIRIVNAAGPIAVPRFLARDLRGLISIGETRNMNSRRQHFVRAAKTGSGHSEANLLYYLRRHSSLWKKYPGHDVEYRFRKQPTKEAAKLAEARMIKSYICQFGEAPPFNSAIPEQFLCEPRSGERT